MNLGLVAQKSQPHEISIPYMRDGDRFSSYSVHIGILARFVDGQQSLFTYLRHLIRYMNTGGT